MGARVIHVCDAFEAMTSDRPYKRAMTSQAALAELARCANTQFDARVVDVFRSMVDQGDESLPDDERETGEALADDIDRILAVSEAVSRR